MSLKGSAQVTEALKAARDADDRLALAALSKPGTWTKDQQEQLGLLLDVIRHTHSALKRLIEANP